ncbi:hypothetical protein Btru_008021 [Bulinus truncatus]|nr:hypothetical protein Btru_008021 [Bulinus truncatus]
MATVMDNPVADIILGNLPDIQDCTKEQILHWINKKGIYRKPCPNVNREIQEIPSTQPDQHVEEQVKIDITKLNSIKESHTVTVNKPPIIQDRIESVPVKDTKPVHTVNERPFVLVCYSCIRLGHTCKACPKRLSNILCFNCHLRGHVARHCPSNSRKQVYPDRNSIYQDRKQIHLDRSSIHANKSMTFLNPWKTIPDRHDYHRAQCYQNPHDRQSHGVERCKVRPGEPEVLDMMLHIYDAMKRDCDINHQNKKLQTVLHLAAREGFLESVKRLMLFGADISLADHKGNTVLHILTSLTITDPGRCERYMEIIETVLDKAPQWYTSNKSNKVTENKETMSNVEIKRRAILNLVCETNNREDLTVLDLACKMGAFEVVQLLVTMEGVMAFKVGKNIRYDISSITPRTNGTLGGMCVKGSVSPRPSCLEWLLAIGEDVPQNAAKILDIQPFSDIETAYSSVSAWAYAVIITVHIIYMILFSWSGLTLLYNERSNPGRREADAPTLITYIVVPLEPAYFIFYNAYTLVKLCCLGELSIRSKLSQSGLKTLLSTFMSVIVGLIYSIFVIIWIITFAVDYNYMDYFLAIALCIGWMFSIVFTRGFKVINYFWRLIQIMIIRDVFKFLFIYLFVLLAFSIAFHALFQVSTLLSDLYPNPMDTMFMMFNMWLGMTFLFGDDSVDQGFSSVHRTSVFIKILYVIYMVLATIVLLNLLIAMMNDSYQEILRKQRQAWRIESVQLGVDVEKSMPITFPIFSKVKVIRGYICPSDEANGIKRWYIDVVKTRQSLEVTRDEEDADKAVLKELGTKMTSMDTRMSEMVILLKNLEQNITTLQTRNIQ